MTKSLIIAAASALLLAGCESSDNRPSQDNRQGYYEPADGRNLAPAMQDASHGDPQFPADASKGGGGGLR